jgi:cyclopropane fatty-acyl-phospholipid synthase-like methyltransferase
MKIYLWSFLLALSSCAQYKHYSHHKKHGEKSNHHHRFNNVKKWERVFENKKRDEWQKPDEVIKFLEVKEDSIIADIGSATGYFPVRLAKVATKGRVWGVDVEPNLVNYLNYRARSEKLDNLVSILGNETDPMIPEPVDFILIVNTYHHIGNRVSYFSNLRKRFKNNGRLVIIDFKKGDLPFGPKDHAKVSRSVIITELDRAGYKISKSSDLLPYQNLLVFEIIK